ncbi:hypothetical protein CBQ26_07660 [Deinococcus indicus]|uniref:Bacterial transcriptional activator domain-containing protein n=1 Tax=Deinococcus indicus TaxID=223556 RepID=A0A246BMF9_9DEIO|nr:AAA family ATPase [Deinococcus indicus]OWL96859.1 hypothetical protein CBQ26_07660 [Deinococcus indicus]
MTIPLFPHRPDRSQQGPTPLPHEITRTHLLADLTRHDRRIAALIAPAGYGKTTLLGQLARAAHAAGQAVAWLTLTHDEADPARLAQELARTCGSLPDFRGERYRASAGLSQEAAFTALARDLNDLPHHLLLIVDQTEMLGGTAGACLGTFLASLGEGHRSAVAGFDLTHLRLGRVLARGGVHLLGAGHLAFTDGEAEQFLSRYPDAPPSPERWPLGLALHAAASESGSTLTPQAYQSELLAALPAQLDDLLDAAATLPSWSTAEFHALGVTPPADWAQRLLGAGLMLRLHGDGTVRPHEVLVAALRARLDGRPDASAALTRRAAQRAEQQRRPLDAARLYVQAGDAASAAELAHRHAPSLEEQGAFDVLRRLLDTLPPECLDAPLRLRLGLCLLHAGDVTRAETALRDLQDRPDTRPGALFLLSVIASRRGDSARQLRLAGQGLDAGPDDRLRTRLLRVQASALNVLGQQEQAREVTHAALTLATDTAQHGEQAHLLALLSGLNAFTRTPLPEREAVVRAGLRAYERAGLHAGRARLHASLAHLHRLQGQLQEAHDELLSAQKLEQISPGPDSCLIHEELGDLRRCQGQDGEARAAYAQAMQHAELHGVTYVQASLAYKLAELARQAGQPAAARTWLAQARSWRVEHPNSWNTRAAHLHEGILAAQTGQTAAALAHLQDALHSRLDLEEQVRAHAWLAQLTPDTDPAHTHYRRELTVLLALLGSACVLRADQPHLSQPATAGSHEPDSPAPRRAPHPSPTAAGVTLDVRLLGGGVQADVNGAPLRLAHSKPAELLAWLALHGPSTREQLVDALTDGGTEQRHVDYVKISVRRLRATLSETPGVSFNPVEFHAGQYRLSPQFTLRVDAHAVQTARQSHDPVTLLQALDAYTGPLLPQVESSWAGDLRLELEEDAIGCALRLAELVHGTDPELAARACRHALSIDPFQQEATRLLVSLTRSAGGHEAARHLERVCQRRLDHQLSA